LDCGRFSSAWWFDITEDWLVGGSWIEIDGRRLQENVRLFRRLIGDESNLMAVVKANAYGHGARFVAPLLVSEVDWFGVDSLVEAEELSSIGIAKPILILGHTERDDAERVVDGGFRQVLFRRDVAEALSEAARKRKTRARVHLKIETGLNRLGVEPVDATKLVEGLEGLIVEGIYTHFADVEDPESTLYQRQVERLRKALSPFKGPLLVHAVPTAGALLHPEESLGLARVGIGLYGIWPSPSTRRAAEGKGALRPVLSWKSRLAQVKNVPAGGSVGYEVTYRAPSERRIGIVPAGYADGFDRRLSNRGRVLVRGKSASVVGRVAMNMFMVDVTEVGAREGDEVVLIGEQGALSITVEEIAETIGTIAYEVLARLSPRLDRRLRSRSRPRTSQSARRRT
jgi:alanine racemase